MHANGEAITEHSGTLSNDISGQPPQHSPTAVAASGLVAAGALRKEGMSADGAAPARAQLQPRAPAAWPMECNLLLAVQFLERLSFHTLKGVLRPHLITDLHMESASADAFILLVTGLTVFTPIVGGAMADWKNGNYGILASMFPLYLIFHLLFTTSPLVPFAFLHPYMDCTALFLMHYTYGATRACLPAYGADQISPPNVPQIGRFFAFFIAAEQFAIVCAAMSIPKLQGLVSTFLPSFGRPLLLILAVSSILLFCATALLMKTNQRFRQILPPAGQNVFSRAYHTVKVAWHNKSRWRQRSQVRSKQVGPLQTEPQGLLEHFLDDHNCERDKECDFGRKHVCAQAKFVDELKVVGGMMLVMAPLPLFWAYHAVMMAIWSAQKFNVDPTVPMFGAVLPPDQLDLPIHIFVLFLIPTFYYFVYPSEKIAKLLTLNTYLKRMASGLFLCALACSMSAAVQYVINRAQPLQQPSPNNAFFKAFNIFPADCTVSMGRGTTDDPGDALVTIPGGGGGSDDAAPLALPHADIAAAEVVDWWLRFNGSACGGHRRTRVRLTVKAGKLNYAVIGPQGILASAMDLIKPFPSTDQTSIGFAIALPCNSLNSQSPPPECVKAKQDAVSQALSPFGSPFGLCPSASDSSASADSSSSSADSSSSSSSCIAWTSDDIQLAQLLVFPPRGDNLGVGNASVYAPKTLAKGTYKVSPEPSSHTDDSASSSDPSASNSSSIYSGIPSDGSGGIALAVLSLDGSPLNQNSTDSTPSSPVLTILPVAGPNTIGAIWLLPQYFLMALFEILLGITALEFCYVQAATTLKATMIAYWYLMIYTGWSFVPLALRFELSPDPMVQLVTAALAMLCAAAMFAGLAHFRYKYKNNLSGPTSSPSSAVGPRRKEATGGGLAEKGVVRL